MMTPTVLLLLLIGAIIFLFAWMFIGMLAFDVMDWAIGNPRHATTEWLMGAPKIVERSGLPHLITLLWPVAIVVIVWKWRRSRT